MQTLNIHEVKAHLSDMLVKVEAGETVVIARRNKPVAKLVRMTEDEPPKEESRLMGMAKVSGDFVEEFVGSQVASGRYGSVDEVMRAGLRLLQEHEAKVKALEAALIEGENSGDFRPFDFDEFKARKRAEYESKHGASVAAGK